MLAQFVRFLAVASVVLALVFWYWPTPPAHLLGYLLAQCAAPLAVAALSSFDPRETVPLWAWLAAWALAALWLRRADREHYRRHPEWRGWKVKGGR